MSGFLVEEVLALLPDSSPHSDRAKQLTETLLQQGAEFRELILQANKEAETKAQRCSEELSEQRQMIYASDSFSAENIAELRAISRKLRGRDVTTDLTETATILAESITENLKRLQELVGKAQVLPYRLQFLADADPETGVVSFQGFDITDSSGRNVWAEYCATCDIEITMGQDRWRCFACVEDNIHCVECQRFWNRHEQCGGRTNLLLLEHEHPVFRRLEVASPSGSLASTVFNIFHVWTNRPCFRQKNVWLTYQQVYDKVARIAALFGRTGASEILLCFPAGSIDFYFADLACALAGITSVGCPVSPPPEVLPEIEFVVCDEGLRTKLNLSGRTAHHFLNLEDADCLEPHKVILSSQDPLDAVYTTYYTSGSTGVPKRVPVTRQVFVSEISASEACIPGCCLSFLPPYWATDRMCVYSNLYIGYRVGFSRKAPTLLEIVEDLQEIQPTMLVTPPTLLQFLMSLHPTASLGDQLQYVSCGGAPVGASVKRFVHEAYGIKCSEGYGTTECGGIAKDGKIVSTVVDVLRLRDTQTGEWMDLKRKGNVVGELWVRDFNTKDLVEISAGGKRLRVIGRSGEASSFKLQNGTWCSLIDIEDEIIRTCVPVLLRQALVTMNSKNLLVLIAVPAQPASDPMTLLQEVRARVALSSFVFPKALVLSEGVFPETQNRKIRRGAVVNQFHDAVEAVLPLLDHDQSIKSSSFSVDVVRLASMVLGHSVNPERSFLENGGDSISAVRWLKDMKLYFPDLDTDWRSFLNSPIAQLAATVSCPSPDSTKGAAKSIQGAKPPASRNADPNVTAAPKIVPTSTIEPMPDVDVTAQHILLTGATGFLGQHVLRELLERDDKTVVVCLVRPQSQERIAKSERVLVVTKVPTALRYRQVIHLAAQVDHIRSYESLYQDNVQLTEDLLRLRLAPFLFCSTSSTQQGQAPFTDGYTQSKFVSEQLVLKCGGSCVWPPFLLWGNKRDWLTRLIQHCVESGTYPTQLEFLPSAKVETCAKELVNGGPCSASDLDLHDLFTRIIMEHPMRPVKFCLFRANAARNPDCALYPILPLLQGPMIGQHRSPELELLPIESSDIKQLLYKVYGCPPAEERVNFSSEARAVKKEEAST